MNSNLESLYNYLDVIGVLSSYDVTVLEDYVETTGRYFEDGQYVSTFPDLVETEYRIAKISFDDSAYTIKYSPELSDALYPYGGLSDIYAEEIKELIKQKVFALTENHIQDVAVVVGERLWSGEVLQCFSDSRNISEVVPQTGLLNIQIVFNDSVGKSSASELVELASKSFADIGATVLLDGMYRANVVDDNRLLHLYWKDGAELQV